MIEDFDELYKIDEERLKDQYYRIKKFNSDLGEIEVISKFLLNQSVGTSLDSLIPILSYFENKMAKDKELLSFALEWIRAIKIRFEYKKYLANAQFNNYKLAVDDCIFLFFLKYDNYIRNLFFDGIKEFEISTLYEIFYSPILSPNFDIQIILEKHKLQVPTIFYESKRINTNIITLRSGLSEIIEKDYNKITSKTIPKITDNNNNISITKSLIEKNEETFVGPHLERTIKSFYLTQNEDSLSELDSATSQFLSSYFKFGQIYEYKEFKDALKNDLIELIYSSSPESIQSNYNVTLLKNRLLKTLEDYIFTYKREKLDGSAWKKDLISILSKFTNDLLIELFKTLEDRI
ncbi:MAG: hypothetical protein P8Y70_03830 [Candidatus Lokiarchaeota archaeon]